MNFTRDSPLRKSIAILIAGTLTINGAEKKGKTKMGQSNAYLQRQTELKQKFLDVGEEMGMQKMWDYVQLALRDPDVMGKDVLGRKRMEKIFEKLKDLSSYYHNAFTDDKEADYTQEKLDDRLREIWGDDLCPFSERYPYFKQFTYTKSRKGWK